MSELLVVQSFLDFSVTLYYILWIQVSCCHSTAVHVNEYQDSPEKLQLISQYFFLEEVSDVSASDKTKL